MFDWYITDITHQVYHKLLVTVRSAAPTICIVESYRWRWHDNVQEFSLIVREYIPYSHAATQTHTRKATTKTKDWNIILYRYNNHWVRLWAQFFECQRVAKTCDSDGVTRSMRAFVCVWLCVSVFIMLANGNVAAGNTNERCCCGGCRCCSEIKRLPLLHNWNHIFYTCCLSADSGLFFFVYVITLP